MSKGCFRFIGLAIVSLSLSFSGMVLAQTSIQSSNSGITSSATIKQVQPHYQSVPVLQTSTDTRLKRLERLLEGRALVDMMTQIQMLQQEVQQLRGQREEHKHALGEIKKRQRDLYTDLDGRISELKQQSSRVVVAPTTSVKEKQKASSTEQVNLMVSVDPVKEQKAYNDAFMMLNLRRYKEAKVKFMAFLKNYSGGSYADNAQYWLGEAYYVTNDYDNALVMFKKIKELYPDSSKLPGAMLKMGYVYYEKKDYVNAKKTLTHLVETYPGSTVSKQATRRLKKIKRDGH